MSYVFGLFIKLVGLLSGSARPKEVSGSVLQNRRKIDIPQVRATNLCFNRQMEQAGPSKGSKQTNQDSTVISSPPPQYIDLLSDSDYSDDPIALPNHQKRRAISPLRQRKRFNVPVPSTTSMQQVAKNINHAKVDEERITVTLREIRTIRSILHNTQEQLNLALSRLDILEGRTGVVDSATEELDHEEIMPASIPLCHTINDLKGKGKAIIIDPSPIFGSSPPSLPIHLAKPNTPSLVVPLIEQFTTVPICEHIYVSGIKRKSLSAVKEQLKGLSLRIQIRHIINLSWVNDQVLEMIIIQRHAAKIAQQIRDHAVLFLVDGFDPLDPINHSWNGRIPAEGKLLALKKSFLQRLADSSSMSSSNKTKSYLSAWVDKRGWSTEYLDMLSQSNKVYGYSVERSESIAIGGPSTVEQPGSPCLISKQLSTIESPTPPTRSLPTPVSRPVFLPTLSSSIGSDSSQC